MKESDAIVTTRRVFAADQRANEATPVIRTAVDADERLHLALEAAGAGAWDWDVAGERLAWSPENFLLYGLDPDRTPTIGDWERCIDPADLERVRAARGDVVAGRSNRYVCEFRIRHSTRGLRWVCTQGRARRDASGRVTHLVGIAMDVTDRKRAEESMRANEQRLRVALGASRLGIWDWDVDSGRLEWDARVREMWGAPEDQPVDLDLFLSRLHPDDVQPVEKALAEAVDPAGPGRLQIEYRVISAGAAAVRWMRATGTMFAEPGRPRRLVGTVEDITERHEAEARLRAEQERYQRIFDVAGVSLWELDWTRVRALIDRWRAAGVEDIAAHCMSDPANLQKVLAKIRVIRVNAETLRLYEAPSREELLRALPTLVLPEARAQWGTILRAFAAGEPRVELERPALTLKGRRFEQLITFAFGERASRAESVLVSLVDITPLKAAAAVLKETNRRKDEFLAMLAHELRNPLAPIRNAAELLRFSEGEMPRVAWAREMIDRQLAHLSRLIDDLLDVSRIVQGKVGIDRKPLDLRTAIEQAVETARPRLAERGHAFTVTLPPAPVPVRGDFVRLTQIFSNLLDNAAKYTREGGSVSLDLATEDEHAVVRVRDSGEGIAPEIVSEIFELFTQGSRSLDRSQGGLGIGLTVVRRLVEMHGGRVTASSPGPGQGSEFQVRLPLARHASDDANDAAPAADPAPHGVTLAARPRVLVVDDNRDAADSLAALLAMEGCDVDVALDGPDAVSQARRVRPDIVVLDIGLPGMDGFEVARTLRGELGLRDTLVIAATGYGRDEDRARALDAGCDHHMVKPIDFTALLSLMSSRTAAKTPSSPH